jgi:hypothetical protein
VFSKELKEITLICSKQVSSSIIPTLKTTLGLHIGSYTTMEEVLNHPWCFYNKVFKVGKKNSLSYATVISITKKWPT